MFRFLRASRMLFLLKLVLVIYVLWILLGYSKVTISTFLLSKLQMIGKSVENQFSGRVNKESSTKYILLWSSFKIHPFPILSHMDVFRLSKCQFQNCIVTTNRSYFYGDLSQFDAIALNGRKLIKYKTASNNISQGSHKSVHQKFIYVNTGSALDYPICSFKFDNIFNWTMTYKLNSDIPYPFIQVRDKSGKIVGPKIDMQWKANMTEVDDDIIKRISKKKRAVAWYLSECQSASKLVDLYLGNALQYELKRLGYNLDILGPCGVIRCPTEHDCSKELDDYYFYLAYERAFGDDYVTGKVLKAIWHYTVPIVYGGANYSRFLPPGSYLNARYTSASRLAAMIVKIIKNETLYLSFFGWRMHYTIQDPTFTDNVCALCAAMNDEKLMKKTEHTHLRSWWNPPPPNKCEKGWLGDGIYVRGETEDD